MSLNYVCTYVATELSCKIAPCIVYSWFSHFCSITWFVRTYNLEDNACITITTYVICNAYTCISILFIRCTICNLMCKSAKQSSKVSYSVYSIIKLRVVKVHYFKENFFKFSNSHIHYPIL